MTKHHIFLIAISLAATGCEKSKGQNPTNQHSLAMPAPPKPSLPKEKLSQIIPIKRLNPDAFNALPRDIQKYLIDGGYTIPQISGDEKLYNVISGRFISAKQLDWAVLASRSGESEILIFSGSSVESPIRIGKGADSDIRFINSANPTYIYKHYLDYNGPKPPTPLDHDGIDDGLDGKASMVWYFHNQKWLHLQGAD